MLGSSVTLGNQEQLKEANSWPPAKTGTAMAPKRSGDSEPNSEGSREQ